MQTPNIEIALHKWYGGIDFESTLHHVLSEAPDSIRNVFRSLKRKKIIAYKCKRFSDVKNIWSLLRQNGVAVIYTKYLDSKHGWIWQLYANAEQYKRAFPERYEEDLNDFKALLCEGVNEYVESRQASMLLELLHNSNVLDDETYNSMKGKL